LGAGRDGSGDTLVVSGANEATVILAAGTTYMLNYDKRYDLQGHVKLLDNFHSDHRCMPTTANAQMEFCSSMTTTPIIKT
jgi:hypothetical protein